MNLTTTSRGLLAALALAGGLLALTGTAAHAAPVMTAPALTAQAVALDDGPEPVELNELGLPDLLED
ncbi:hypothetical protein ACF065_07790 [Streptomyces sp. NPDC015232]|uniref:hypothetical protein n=1 Tax=unclassified Streptomyces TaxID=2593676 RepID=UPI0036FC4E41